uniref:UDENN domain-containing protein n=1 Tax=Macrostomum lignano TaxID=282301 RepID=A0A1I8JPY9_9PLAT
RIEANRCLACRFYPQWPPCCRRLQLSKARKHECRQSAAAASEAGEMRSSCCFCPESATTATESEAAETAACGGRFKQRGEASAGSAAAWRSEENLCLVRDRRARLGRSAATAACVSKLECTGDGGGDAVYESMISATDCRPAENVYDVAGFEHRRTASIQDLTSGGSVGIVSAVFRRRRRVRHAPPQLIDEIPQPAAGDQQQWRRNVLGCVSDAFSGFRRLSATAAGAYAGASDSEDDDDERSAGSGSLGSLGGSELSDRVRRAELTRLRSAAALHSGLLAQRCRHDQLFSGCCLIRLRLSLNSTRRQPVVLPSGEFLRPALFGFSAELLLSRRRVPGNQAATAGGTPAARLPGGLRPVQLRHHRAAGLRFYGYCMRCLAPDPAASNSAPAAAGTLVEAVCIVSPVESEQLFHQILLEALRKRLGAATPEQGRQELEDFLVSVYSRPLPDAGGWFDLVTTDPGRSGQVSTVQPAGRSPPAARVPLAAADFPGARLALQLFSAALHERQIALVSANPRRLSQCVQALAGLLYPLRWQHTLVPVVPADMLRIVCSPTPFILGGPGRAPAPGCPCMLFSTFTDPRLPRPCRCFKTTWTRTCSSSALTTRASVRQRGDESRLLPRKLRAAAWPAWPPPAASRPPGAPLSSWLSRTFLQLFVVAVGHYADHVTIGPTDGRRRFDRESFLLAPRSRGLRASCASWPSLAYFHVFISDVLDGSAYAASKLTVSTVLRDFDQARRGGSGAKRTFEQPQASVRRLLVWRRRSSGSSTEPRSEPHCPQAYSAASRHAPLSSSYPARPSGSRAPGASRRCRRGAEAQLGGIRLLTTRS